MLAVPIESDVLEKEQVALGGAIKAVQALGARKVPWSAILRMRIRLNVPAAPNPRFRSNRMLREMLFTPTGLNAYQTWADARCSRSFLHT